MTDLQQEIEKTIAKITHLDTVRAHLATTEEELSNVQKEIRWFEASLRKGMRELEQLDGLNTKALFYKILGSRETQLEEERQNFLELHLKHEDAINRQKILEYEINLLKAKVGNESLLKIQLEKLKKLRESEIIENDPGLRQKLLSISDKLETSYRLSNELHEAIQAGEICINLTTQVIVHLQKVSNWGHWGQHKGHYRMHLKKEAIDRARNIAFQVKHHLHIFDTELRDVGKRLSVELDFDVLDNFTNFFFDNLITDWIFRQKLTRALASVRKTKSELIEIMNWLNLQFSKTREEVDHLKDAREKVLMS